MNRTTILLVTYYYVLFTCLLPSNTTLYYFKKWNVISKWFANVLSHFLYSNNTYIVLFFLQTKCNFFTFFYNTPVYYPLFLLPRISNKIWKWWTFLNTLESWRRISTKHKVQIKRTKIFIPNSLIKLADHVDRLIINEDVLSNWTQNRNKFIEHLVIFLVCTKVPSLSTHYCYPFYTERFSFLIRNIYYERRIPFLLLYYYSKAVTYHDHINSKHFVLKVRQKH